MNTLARELPAALAPQLFGGIPGLVWAYRFGADGSAVLLDFPVDPATLEDAGRQGDWLWLHFAQSDTRAAAYINQLDLPQRAKATLLSHDEHLSLHLEGDVAFGVLADWQHALEDEFGQADARAPNEDREIGRLHFALSDGLVISTRRRALHSVHQLRARLDQGAKLESAPRVLESIIEQFALSVAEVTHELGESLDGIEDRVLSDRSGDERRDLGRLRRRAVRMHRPLKALRRVIGQFEQRHAQRSHAMVAVAARLLQRFDELDNDIVVIQDRAKLLHDEVSAKLTDQTNRQLYFLSILTALFLPPTLVVGVFGMNTKGLPLTDDASGFAIAMTICVASSAIVYGVLRRMGIR
jgi:zinc transporter